MINIMDIMFTKDHPLHKVQLNRRRGSSAQAARAAEERIHQGEAAT
jgi:hypothetical protein